MALHYTVSIYIRHDQKVLLHRHRKLDIVMLVGGLIRTGETPEEAAGREALEETGLHIRIVKTQGSLKFPDSIELARPAHLRLEEATTGHQCVSFVFSAIADTFELFPQQGESAELMWLTESDIKAHKLISEYVKYMALEALYYKRVLL